MALRPHPGTAKLMSVTTLHTTTYPAWKPFLPYSVVLARLNSKDDLFVLAVARPGGRHPDVGDVGTISVDTSLTGTPTPVFEAHRTSISQEVAHDA